MINLRNLHLEQVIWYKGIECFIDVLISSKVFSGRGNVRVVPVDRKLHKDEHIQGDGNWVSKEDLEHLSLTSPPKEIITPTCKSGLNIKKQNMLLTELYTHGELLLKLNKTVYTDTVVTMDGITKSIHTRPYDAKSEKPPVPSGEIFYVMLDICKVNHSWWNMPKEIISNE